ncbi:unnamed protein product [Kuraishia capsulata CBS 1993]|uniref:CBS domain-containing protein n=1 Tax=Kuraishia capsulata CBS 1993 TaxID=1382522 RepID=W6MNH8_9ASCO|nr:uncharacterized protein KUCA_T00002565001 [Kuraishia capsulata CBS 1993]CDK26592.1 unnamed protein product [Kuraishia capsulata CBS 1993]
MSSSGSNYPNSPSFRTPGSPGLKSRQTSIVEMLSSPPQLDPGYENITSIDLSAVSPQYGNVAAGQLSRNTSLSSHTSSIHSALQTSGDWYEVPLSELVEQNKLILIRSDVSVELAFDTLVRNNLTSVPVEQYANDLNCLTFDYTDLNSYLLLVLNKLKAEKISAIDYEPKSDIPLIIMRAQKGESVPVSFVIKLTNKNPFIKLNETDTLSTVVEIMGNGVHRVAITNNNKITGILSQRRLIKYLWENARRFPSLEPVLNSSLQTLNIGSNSVVSIYGDQLLMEALLKMHDLMISSLAVIDRNHNLLGNISVTDVKHVSKSSKSDLLYKSCLHFISVILGTRGLENGKDSFPIFHVTTNSSLARTIAKLVATQSHRLWIVRPYGEDTKPQSNVQQTQPVSQSMHFTQSNHSSASSINSQNSPIGNFQKDDSGHPGRLVGVVSLTDILSFLAKTLGKDHVDPTSARKQRRRSSSSSNRSVNSRSSLEQFRRSVAGAAEFR